ncbi:MAG: endonuclease Q family protein [SAR324 cluster bacterium]|nr:endonuclease Q family protein [SAR324 cluster bacterium]
MFIADLHIHSHFSRATSRESHLFGLAEWAKLKGVDVLGTGDFTHPEWFAQIKKNLLPSKNHQGLFEIKEKSDYQISGWKPQGNVVNFMLTAEISSIYKKNGKVRKIHTILVVPDFASVERLNKRLEKIGNIHSDGRPILGLDAKDLLEIMLEEAPEGYLIPAHIWTPWFSLFGSKSGFDSIGECFEDLTPHIFALETGLSSDPAMNRKISALDSFNLVANSDCHSPWKLGREANIFTCEKDFFSLREALKDSKKGFLGTLDFYPDEGKYHLDGHRKCSEQLTPDQTRAQKGLCSGCGKPVTVGVLNRIEELSDRMEPVFQRGEQFESLIPLAEIIGEIMGQGVLTKGVQLPYFGLLNQLGSELGILRDVPLDAIEKAATPVLAEAISRMRYDKVIRFGGYDGDYGKISLFSEIEKKAFSVEAKQLKEKLLKEVIS